MITKNVKYNSQSLAFVLIVLGFIVVINYLASRKFIRLDFTANKEYSISPATKKILKGLDDIINIKVYFSKNLPPNLKTVETNVRDLLSEYNAYGGKNLRITYEDPGANEDAKSKVRALGIPEIQMQTFEKDKAQVINGFLGIAVLYADKKEVLPVVQDMRNFEYDLTQAIMKVARTTTPKIGVLKTDTFAYIPPDVVRRMNMDIKDQTEEKFKPIFENLKNNYEVETVDISDGQQIKKEIRTLIVPGGDDKSFTERDLFEIDQYFMQGGNLIVLADAVKIDFKYGVNGSAQDPKILQLLEHYGARVEKNMVLDASCGQVQIPQRFGQFQMNVAVPYPYFVRVTGEGFDRNTPAVSGLGDIILPWPSSITLLVNQADTAATAKKSADTATVEARVLAQSSEKSWTAAGYFNLDPNQKWAPPSKDMKRSNLAVYLSGPFKSYFAGKTIPTVKEPQPSDSVPPTLSAADSARQIVASTAKGHLIVVGEADFLTTQNATPGNIGFLLNVVDWLSQDDNLIAIRSRNLVDRTIQKDALKEGSVVPMVVRVINLALMPALIVVLGLLIFLRRREAAAAVKPAASGTSAATAEQGGKSA